MPRNNLHIPRAERVAALVAAARAQFVEHGYEATTIAVVARASGVSANNVLWYFGTKDALFAAAVQSLLDDTESAVAADPADDPEERLVQILEAVEPYRPLHATVTARRHDPDIGAVYDRVHGWIDAAFVAAIQPHLDAQVDREIVVDIVHMVLDGNATAGPRVRPFQDIVGFLIRSVLADPQVTSNPAATRRG